MAKNHGCFLKTNQPQPVTLVVFARVHNAIATSWLSTVGFHSAKTHHDQNDENGLEDVQTWFVVHQPQQETYESIWVNMGNGGFLSYGGTPEPSKSDHFSLETYGF